MTRPDTTPSALQAEAPAQEAGAGIPVKLLCDEPMTLADWLNASIGWINSGHLDLAVEKIDEVRVELLARDDVVALSAHGQGANDIRDCLFRIKTECEIEGLDKRAGFDAWVAWANELLGEQDAPVSRPGRLASEDARAGATRLPKQPSQGFGHQSRGQAVPFALASESNSNAVAQNADARAAAAHGQGAGAAVPSFQARVAPWVVACFGDEVARDELERMDRFVEEVFEAVQSRGYDPARIDALNAYVYGREPGETRQEIGGVMMTLAAWCNAIGQDMHEAAEAELTRVWCKVDTIRAKQAAKPKGSALPVAAVFKLEDGKCYRSHEGKKVGPVYRSERDLGIWYSRTKAGGGDWHDDGRALHGFPPSCPPHYDLVAEWVEPAPARDGAPAAPGADGVEALIQALRDSCARHTAAARDIDGSSASVAKAEMYQDEERINAGRLLDAVRALQAPPAYVAGLVDAYGWARFNVAAVDGRVVSEFYSAQQRFSDFRAAIDKATVARAALDAAFARRADGAAAGVANLPSQESLAAVIHLARWKDEDTRLRTPFSEEYADGRAYCMRIARHILMRLSDPHWVRTGAIAADRPAGGADGREGDALSAGDAENRT